jgi:predicted P-loop ATPase
VFFGSTNDRYFLKGIGGDRRFWPVDTDPAKKVKDWSEYTDEEIDQIWAEAKACYLQGDKLFLPPHLEKEAKERQKEHIELDSWESEIDAWLDEPVAENWWDSAGVDFMDESEKTAKRYSVTIAEIWKDCIKGKYAVDYASQRRIVNIMSRKSGWEYKRHRRGEDRKQYRGWINENYR